jgi:hypothetical protein
MNPKTNHELASILLAASVEMLKLAVSLNDKAIRLYNATLEPIAMPEELKTTVENFNKLEEWRWMSDKDYIYIGRGGPVGPNRYWLKESKWHNPYHIGKDGDRDTVIAKYKEYFLGTTLIHQIHELRGKTLVCHCHPNACHGDFLAELANNANLMNAILHT